MLHAACWRAAQGLGPTILRNTPANAVYLGNFEMLKQAYCRTYNVSQAEIPGWVVLCSAGAAVWGGWGAGRIGSGGSCDGFMRRAAQARACVSGICTVWIPRRGRSPATRHIRCPAAQRQASQETVC